MTSRARLSPLLLGSFILAGCSVFYTRPVQEMNDTQAALRAAKEVQADTLAPELYRQANEWFFRARQEYKFKNFKLSQSYANKSRYFAEQAEFEAIRNGGNRGEAVVTDPMAAGAPSGGGSGGDSGAKPYDYPTPTATPVESYPAPGGTTPNPAPGP